MNGSTDRIFMSPRDRRRAPGMKRRQPVTAFGTERQGFPKGPMVRPINSYASSMLLSMARGGLAASCRAAPVLQVSVPMKRLESPPAASPKIPRDHRLPQIEPMRLYRQIADLLSERIDDGVFPVGSLLPAERDLAQQLGVSRTSVREALIALEVSGKVSVRVGHGVQILEAMPRRGRGETAEISDGDIGPIELMEARRHVELKTASSRPSIAVNKIFNVSSRRSNSNLVRNLCGRRSIAPAIGIFMSRSPRRVATPPML